MSHTLLITNDFPPRAGGIQTFCYELACRFNPSDITVLASSFDGDAQFDAQLPFRVVRSSSKVLLPTTATLRLARQLITETGARNVIFGAAAPLGLLAKPLRGVGVINAIALTHGHEVGWAKTPVTASAIRKIATDVDVVTYLGQYTRDRIQQSVRQSDRAKFVQLAPGVDPTFFSPAHLPTATQLRSEIGFANRPTIVCVSRLMARKGQDALIEAMPQIQQQVPGTALIIVGDGPYRAKLEQKVRALALSGDVHFTGKVAYEQLPAWYLTGDVFAMPCRTRNAGWDVEGLGIVYLEASACGLPVVAGNSGGAPDAVLNGQTGIVVDGRGQSEIVGAIAQLLTNRALASQMGGAGRVWVEQKWTWDHSYRKLRELLI